MVKLIATCLLLTIVGVVSADPHRPGKYLEHDKTVINCAKYKREANQHSCVLSTFNTEGPYYLPDDPERSDITEGQDGIILDLTINLVNSNDCTPLENMYVHLWHANATGKYSGVGGGGKRNSTGQPGSANVGSPGQDGPRNETEGFGQGGTGQEGPGQGGPGQEGPGQGGPGQGGPGQGGPGQGEPGQGGQGRGGGGGGGRPSATTDERFLRGYQVTDTDGQVKFTTIIPGWYSGRSLHMHLEVYPRNTTEREDISYVGQIFFENDFPNSLMLISPYTDNTNKLSLNERDGIYKNHGNETILDLIPNGQGYRSSITFGIDPTAATGLHH